MGDEEDNVWPVSLFGCCSYKSPETNRCTWCPGFFPQAVNAPCIGIGKLETWLIGEKPIRCCLTEKCGLGKRGLLCCVLGVPGALFFPLPLTPYGFICTALIRRRIVEKYNVQTVGCESWAQYVCFPCALYQAVTFMEEKISVQGKPQAGLITHDVSAPGHQTIQERY